MNLKNIINKKLTGATLILGLLSMMVFQSTAHADHPWGNYLGNYHWKYFTTPVELDLIDNMTSDWDAVSEHLLPNHYQDKIY